jgi:hypothetical protein
MLVETAMPRFDSVITEHAVVRADPAATFRAAQNLDFLAVRTPLLTASMWIRGADDARADRLRLQGGRHDVTFDR